MTTPCIILPEIVLLDTVNAAISFVKRDYESHSDKTKSYLYLLLNGAALERYDLFQQAVQVICGSQESPRLFQIDLAFNSKMQAVPSAHITLPSEQTAQGNGMGSDEGYVDAIEEYQYQGEFNNDFNNDFNNGNDTGYSLRPIFSRNISATYNVVIMSDNTNEVLLLYHFLRAMLFTLVPHFHMKGLKNISFGGQDLQPYEGLGQNLHMRALTVSLQYDMYVPSIFPSELITNITSTGVPKNELVNVSLVI
jgi:hypothetical protein